MSNELDFVRAEKREGARQTSQRFDHAVSTIEVVLVLGEVPAGVLCELECVVDAGDAGLEVVQDHVDRGGLRSRMLGLPRPGNDHGATTIGCPPLS